MMLARGEEGGDKFSNSFSRLIDIARERDANQQHFHVYQFVRVFRQFSQEWTATCDINIHFETETAPPPSLYRSDEKFMTKH